jgi:hypothetical protein
MGAHHVIVTLVGMADLVPLAAAAELAAEEAATREGG